MATMVTNLSIFKNKKTYYHPPHPLIRIYKTIEIMGKLRQQKLDPRKFMTEDDIDDFLDDEYHYQQYQKRNKRKKRDLKEE